MTKFKPGDRVRRIKNGVPRYNMPVGSEFEVSSVDTDNWIFLKEYLGNFSKIPWNSNNFELVEEKEMPKYLLIEKETGYVVNFFNPPYVFDSLTKIQEFLAEERESLFDYVILEVKEIKVTQKVILEVEK